ncbi:MAG: AAA family ATPase [Myxococcales bacterium]|nr:AAA family ATPase [Myxococcales bacterium]
MTRKPRPGDAPLDPGPEDDAIPAVVREELHLLQKVQQAISQSRGVIPFFDYENEMLALRDTLAEERLAEDQASIIEQMDRTAALAAARVRRTPERVDARCPYFGHLVIRTDDGRTRELMVGPRAFLAAGVRIVDWRDAPVARIFYRYREGDNFVEDIAGREWSGVVVVRRLLTIVDGALVRVQTPDEVWVRTRQGFGRAGGEYLLAGGAGSALRPENARPFLGVGPGEALRADLANNQVAALLDPRQYELVTSPGTGMVVVRGGAGSGKTTVVLHRLAFLAGLDPQRFRARRMLVVVFNRALAAFVSRVLAELGVHDVPVVTLARWTRTMMQRHFRQLTPYRSQNPPAAVVRFKTHALLLPALEEAARATPRADPVGLFDELFTDRGWLAACVARHAPGCFSDSEITQIHRWCSDLQGLRSESRPGDEEDPDRPEYDEADEAILLRLHQLLRGPLLHSPGHKLAYDHLAIDEAEDLGPLELSVLLPLARENSLTLAGDAAQRLGPGDFSSWEEILPHLAAPAVEVSPLQVSYRCTRPILEFARAVLGEFAPPDTPRAVREGAPVELLRAGSRGAAMTFLSDALSDLARREPRASVAVLARDATQARQAYQILAAADLPGLRLALDQDFAFTPAIEVSEIAQSKGLEFDYVILLNPNPVNFPPTRMARQLWHVGATRAIHQLWVVCWDPPSPALPPLPPRLVG